MSGNCYHCYKVLACLPLPLLLSFLLMPHWPLWRSAMTSMLKADGAETHRRILIQQRNQLSRCDCQLAKNKQ